MGVEAVAGDNSRVPHGDQVEPRCEVEAPLDPRILKDKKQGTPVEDLISVSICVTDPTKTVKIGSNLSEEQRERLITFLHEHHDVFAGPTRICRVSHLPSLVTNSMSAHIINRSNRSVAPSTKRGTMQLNKR